MTTTPIKRDAVNFGVWFFSAVAGIALVLAAVTAFRAGGNWLLAGIGLGAGAVLIAAGELWAASRYPVTAKALDAAGIGILGATLYAMGARWSLVPLAVSFIGLLIVTALAVFLATRRDSIFIALLGLLGGFVNAYLLSTTENYPLAVFAWLLALNIGIAWLAAKKGWWLLHAVAVVLTAIYQWAWALQAVTVGRLVIAAAIFTVFAVTATVPLWHRAAQGCPRGYRWLAVAAAHLPLLFALYVAGQVNYGPQFNVLFAFLLVVDAGLMAIVWRGGPKWLHAAGAMATLLTWSIWLRVSYVEASWPMLLVWAALFVALYLARITPFSGVMFALFIGVAWRQPEHWAAIVVVMLALLAVAVVRGRPWVAATAVAMSAIALMLLHPPLWTLVALHALLLLTLFAIAWTTGQHLLAVMAIPFYLAMIATASATNAPLLVIAAVPYVLFAGYALLRTSSPASPVAPYAAAALASLVLLVAAWNGYAGVVALVEAAVMLVLLWRAGSEPRITLAAAAMLALLNLGIAQLLPIGWVVAVWAVESAALVWLFLRVKHPVALLFGFGLAVVVFFQLAFNASLFVLYLLYALCGAAMFVAAYGIRYYSPLLQRIFSVFCLFELWFLINLVIANWFHSSNGAVVFDFAASQPAENAVYTVSWAAIATGLLILGFLIRWPAARGAALSLLVAAVLKCFFNDLPRLSGSWLTASLAGLGLSVAVVGVVLQRRWTGKSIGLDLPAKIV